MPIPYQLFTCRNRKSSNQIPSEIKLEDWLISYWYHLYGYSVLIKVLGSKAYLVVPVHSETIKLEVLEIGISIVVVNISGIALMLCIVKWKSFWLSVRCLAS